MMTEKVIRNFRAQEANLDYEIILIDNKSQEHLDEKLFSAPDLKMIKNSENIGFAKAVNQGIRIAQGDFILLLNSDVLIRENCISRMIAYLADHKDAGLIGPRYLFPSGKPQAGSGRFPGLLSEFLRLFKMYNLISSATIMSLKEINDDRIRDVDWLSGGCLLFPKRLIDKIGYLDEKFFLGGEDFDFCFRAKNAGFQAIYYPKSEVIHYHGYSSGGTGTVERIKHDRDGIDYFFEKHFPRCKIKRFLIFVMHNVKISLKK